jgi:hypothetical protein
MRQFAGSKFVMAVLFLFALFTSPCFAQNTASPTPNPYVYTVPADPATGVTQFTLTGQNASGNYQILATSAICGFKGVALETQQGGTIDLAFGGLTYLKMDGTSTIGDIVLPSTSTAGFGHDPGYSARPASSCVVGIVEQSISSSLAQVFLMPPEVGLPPLVAPNDGSTGTTQFASAKINAAGNAINATTGDTAIPTYPVLAGAGTSGNAALAYSGPAYGTMDSTIASGAGGFYIINSTTAAHEFHAQSAAPSAGVWVVGYLISSSTTSGSSALIQVNGYVFGGSGSAPTAGSGISVSGTAVSENVSDRTLYQAYDEFSLLISSTAYGSLAWDCPANSTGYTVSVIPGPTNTGALDFASGATASHDNECFFIGTQSSAFGTPYGNMSGYTFDLMFTFQASSYGNATTGQRIYVGAANARMGGAPTDGFLVRYDPTLGTPDTTFHVACYKGSTTPVADVSSGLGAPTVSQNYSIEIYSTTAGTIGMQIFSNTGASLYNNASVCTGSNVTAASLGPAWGLTQEGSSNVTFDMDRYSMKITGISR